VDDRVILNQENKVVKINNLFDISEAARIAIGKHFFRPYKKEIVDDGKIKIIHVDDYDGRLATYDQCKVFLSNLIEFTLQQLHDKEKENIELYRNQRKENKEKQALNKGLKIIKDKMKLRESIFEEVRESANIKDQTD
jgi:hypothetical protein